MKLRLILLTIVLAVSTFSTGQPAENTGAKGTLVVLNKSEATVSLIDLNSGKIVATLPTGDGPHEAATSPDGRTVVVTNYGRQRPGESLTVIDLGEQRVVKTIKLAPYTRPHGIQFLPDGKRVLVTAEGAQSLILVNIETGKVEKAVATGQKVSHMVAYSPEHQRAFVANIGSGTVTVVDTKNWAKIKDIATGKGAEGIDLHPNGKEVWVTNRSDNTISVIDPGTLAIKATFSSGGEMPIRVRFTPDGRHALVSNARTGNVVVFDTQKRKQLHSIKMQAKPVESKEGRLFAGRMGDSPVPVGVLIPPDGKTAFVANTNADQITVIDLSRWEIRGTLRAGKEPDGMAFSPLPSTPKTQK